MEQFPALNTECFDQHIAERLHLREHTQILILYGSVRERSYSRFAAGSRSPADGDGRGGETLQHIGLSRMGRRTRTLRSPNYAAWSDGVTGWCGARGAAWGNERGYEGTNRRGSR